jgi:hypothetical protein
MTQLWAMMTGGESRSGLVVLPEAHGSRPMDEDERGRCACCDSADTTSAPGGYMVATVGKMASGQKYPKAFSAHTSSMHVSELGTLQCRGGSWRGLAYGEQYSRSWQWFRKPKEKSKRSSCCLSRLPLPAPTRQSKATTLIPRGSPSMTFQTFEG